VLFCTRLGSFAPGPVLTHPHSFSPHPHLFSLIRACSRSSALISLIFDSSRCIRTYLHSFQCIRARFGSFTLVSIYSHSSTQIPTSTRGGGGRYHEGVPIPLIVTIEDARVTTRSRVGVDQVRWALLRSNVRLPLIGCTLRLYSRQDANYLAQVITLSRAFMSLTAKAKTTKLSKNPSVPNLRLCMIL